jgi:hypothetical protein
MLRLRITRKRQRLIFSTVLPRESSSFIFRPFA